MSLFIALFYEFFKTGLFAVGGGLATIPFLKEIAKKYSWFSMDSLTDMIAISEATPGPIGVNMATYAGYNAGNYTGGYIFAVLGGIFSTLSLVLPSVIVIIFVSKFLEKFKGNKIVDSAFYAIRPASAALITAAILDVFVTAVTSVDLASILKINSGLTAIRVDYVAIAIFAVLTFFVVKFKKINPIVIIAVGAILGIIFKL